MLFIVEDQCMKALVSTLWKLSYDESVEECRAELYIRKSLTRSEAERLGLKKTQRFSGRKEPISEEPYEAKL